MKNREFEILEILIYIIKIIIVVIFSPIIMLFILTEKCKQYEWYKKIYITFHKFKN